MNIDRKVILALVGAVLVLVVVWWAMGQNQIEVERQATMQRDQWGPSADYERLCRAELPEQIGQIDPSARVAFWVPRDVDSRSSTIRAYGTRPPLASGKDNVTHVACAQFVRVVAETCSYEGGVSIDRRRYDAEVTLVDMKARLVVAKWHAEGSAPNPCPDTVRRRRSDPKPSAIDGGEPNLLRGLHALEAFKKPR